MTRFLVVDDSRTSRMILVQSLRAAGGDGVEVAEAPDAETALKAFHQTRPDVTFLDMVLDVHGNGGAGGRSVLDAILTEDPAAKVVLVTALKGDHPDVIGSISQGAFGFLAKPVRLDDVREILQTVESESGRLQRIK